MTAEEELHWLALHMVPGIGARKSVHLLQTFRTPEGVFRAPREALEGAGLSRGIAQSIVSGCVFEDAVDQQERLRANGVQLVPIAAEAYPPRLKQIYDPPLLLFALGKVDLLGSVMIAVVGTRRPSTYGAVAAERLSADLAQANLTIVSGMARGIDTTAHRAALSVGGSTIAVFGSGIDIIYPAENKKLAAEIANKGLILSEYPMGAAPYPQNFPVRNRIVSGMSSGVLVVEGAQYSGSAITARLAMDQGREVFAIPGNITSKMSWGPNLLIKQGAKLVQDWNDIVLELTPEDRRSLVIDGQPALDNPAEPTPPESPQSAVKKALLSHLRVDEPIHLDTITETLEYHSSSELIAALFELEMCGQVRQLPGKSFVKVW
jgi:DNA processing protein